MAKDKSAAWDLAAVVRQLRGQVGADGAADAHVFLDETVGGDVHGAAREMVDTATRKVGKGAKADIGKVHDLARSFSVHATPAVIARLGQQPGVRAILPSEIDDVFPHPTGQRPA